MVKHAIFDLDGTLIDSAPSILECLKIVLLDYKIKPIIPLTYRIIGPPLDATLKNITGIDDEQIIAGLIDGFKKIYDIDGYKASICYEGVNQMLSNIASAGIGIHLVTNKRLKPTKKILEYFLWGNFFDSIYTLDSVAHKFKSKSEMLETCLIEKNINPTTTIYIGDTNADFKAAKLNKIPFIFVEWGYEKKGVFNYSLSVSNIQDLTEKILVES